LIQILRKCFASGDALVSGRDAAVRRAANEESENIVCESISKHARVWRN
jgi:hypothetical protein